MSEATPLKLADGTIIYPSNDDDDDDDMEQPSFVEVPTHQEAVEEVTQRRVRLNELPDIPARVNIISIVLSYHLMGISNDDIASVLEIPVERVGRIMMSDAFSTIKATITEQILERDADVIRSTFRRGAKNAAKKVSDLVNHPNPVVSLNAAKDILDRDGHRPTDVVEHRHQVEGGLQIQYIRKSDESKVFDTDFKVLLNKDEGLFE